MTIRFAFGYIIVIILIYNKVASWTIDLPEVRRYVFEKNEKEKNYLTYTSNKQTFYDNIDENSKHNSKSGDYVDSYQSEPKDVKQVLQVVEHGSAYLEGLRRAVERYIDFLENCTSTNNTRINIPLNSTWQPRHEFPDIANNTPAIINQSLPVLNDSLTVPFTNVTWQSLEKGRSGNFSTGNGTARLCQNVTKASEYVRRLAQLAVATTKRLQDLVYAEEYQYDDGKEEDELIFKLAWFLDRLAQMTGFVPNPKQFLEDEPRQTTTTIPFPMVPSSLPVPPDVVRFMALCLKMESPIPATVRCAVPVPLPAGLTGPTNATDNAASILQPSTISDPASTVDSIPEQSSLELLTATDSFSALSKNHNPFLKRSVRSQTDNPTRDELSDLTDLKTVKKRSIEENPTIKLMKYYVKHSVWMNANPKKNSDKLDTKGFEVKNHLTGMKTVKKRSIVLKKNNHIRVPAVPMPDLSRYVKTKPGITYLKDHVILDKIKKILESIHRHRVLHHKHKLAKPLKVVKKRSITYERLYFPRVSENPMQDNTYYVKNKEGTGYNPSALQAARSRAALERHFQNGNILVVRQYGANYNPLVPSQFYAGVLRMISDA